VEIEDAREGPAANRHHVHPYYRRIKCILENAIAQIIEDRKVPKASPLERNDEKKACGSSSN